MRVAILHNRVSGESSPDDRDVLVQARAVAGALWKVCPSPEMVECSLDLGDARDRIESHCPDVVFNLVESLEGHDRLAHLAPALLESLWIPFTGAGADASYMTANKLIAKRVMHSAGVPTPDWLDPLDAHHKGPALSRSIMKRVWEHASRGMSDASVLDTALTQQEVEHHARRLDVREVFFERYIEGREFNIALLADPHAPGGAGVRVLPPAEIVFQDYPAGKPKIVGYAAKWDAESFEFSHTPRRFDFGPEDRALLERLREISLECWRVFRLGGYARVDFRVDESGEPWVLEVNTNPCLSPDAGFFAALTEAGIPFDDAVGMIIADAMKRHHGGTRSQRGGY